MGDICSVKLNRRQISSIALCILQKNNWWVADALSDECEVVGIIFFFCCMFPSEVQELIDADGVKWHRARLIPGIKKRLVRQIW